MSEWRMEGLERKFHRPQGRVSLGEGMRIAGYASVFGEEDQGGDTIAPGAFGASLAANAGQVKMLWQHDPSQPIGVWDEIREDARGLYVAGQLLPDVAKAREAAALIAAGALDGLSIGYRTKRATRGAEGKRRLLEVELWEVSLVTFPMLRSAQLRRKSDPLTQLIGQLSETFAEARHSMARRGAIT